MKASPSDGREARSAESDEASRVAESGSHLVSTHGLSQRRHFGCRRLHALLCREGWRVNHKAVHRIYVEEGLRVRNRKRVSRWLGRQSIRWPVTRVVYDVTFKSPNLSAQPCGCAIG